jgi:hypothetical protein
MAFSRACRARRPHWDAQSTGLMLRTQLLFIFLCFAASVHCKDKPVTLGSGDEDIAGPIVKSHSTSAGSASSGNITLSVNGTLGEEKKKTIAQIIDEALEQEFPEEKPEKFGKNYNETALQEDVSRCINRMW